MMENRGACDLKLIENRIFQGGKCIMSELDDLLDQIKSKYAVEIVPLKIGDKTLKLLQIKDLEEYIAGLVEGGSVPILDLPFWAKVWESSFLLAYFLGRRPVVLGQRMLEIGGGIGAVGIYAAMCGHNVTITDINEDALLFARANVLLNGVARAQVQKLDWNEANLPDPYDVIVGAEVIYDRESYPLLVNFLRRAIVPKGMIFLAKNANLHAPKFFVELTQYFEFKQNVQTIGSGEDAQKIELFAIRLKADGKGMGN